MVPAELLLALWVAGLMLFTMSVMDTLAYGVRTAGVLTGMLAMGLSLFNTTVVISRFSNMLQAAVLGTLPDQVNAGTYTADHVLIALRWLIVFVIAGVVAGALFMPTFIRLISRGLEVLEERGNAPAVVVYGLRRLHHFGNYALWPRFDRLRNYVGRSALRTIPARVLILNVFVTAFYTIGVMSTLLAASWDHRVASSANMLSGIVNGIASVLLFVLVDPPAAIIIDQCMRGKRPVEHAKTLNVLLVITRLMGTMLALVLLPFMARYVLSAAYLFNSIFGGGLGPHPAGP